MSYARINQIMPELPARRSLIDPSIIIDANHSLIAIIGKPAQPFTLYLETYKKTPHRAKPYTFTIQAEYHLLKMNYVLQKSEGNLTIWESVKNVPLEVYGCWAYKKKIKNHLAKDLYEYKLGELCESPALNSFQFYQKLLIAVNIIVLPETIKLSYISKNPSPLTKEAYTSYIKHFGQWYNSVIDYKKEKNWTADILNADAKLSTQEQLESLCARRFQIDWNSNLGKNIQFVQERLNLYIFTYKILVEDQLIKNVPRLPRVLLPLIVEYLEEIIDLISNIAPPLHRKNIEKEISLKMR